MGSRSSYICAWVTISAFWGCYSILPHPVLVTSHRQDLSVVLGGYRWSLVAVKAPESAEQVSHW